jgi:uncharacterized protein YgiM (DUF1202 family)
MRKITTVLCLIVSMSLFTATSAFSQQATVKRNSNLRKSPTTSSAILEQLDAGSQVTLTSNRKRSGYYHVRAEDGAVGWALARNISVGGESPTPSGSSTPQPGNQGFDPGCTLPFDSIKKKHPIIDDSCSIDGSKQGGGKLSKGKLAENHLKNNFCLTGTPIDISYEDLSQLQLKTEQENVSEAELNGEQARSEKLGHLVTVDGHSLGEGTLVRLVIHVISGMADYADTAAKQEKGESVNCYRLSEEENDIHIPLGQDTNVDECLSVTAEMSPHFRPVKWTPNSINSVGKHPVRVTGQLFYDSSHKPCKPGKPAAPKRISLWEIHPVYAFEVCTSSTDIDQCKAAPDSDWKPLDEFAP